MALAEVMDQDVVYHLRDIDGQLCMEWNRAFDKYNDTVKVSKGDIFKGAPSVDAIVSPANSWGFMDGSIDLVYSRHFGWQMQERLQKLLHSEYDGELLVGQAVIIPTYDEEGRDKKKNWSDFNQGKEVKWLISAPTMRAPKDVSSSVNAFLAFRAVIRAVRKHNQSGKEPIRSVLCPGLATCVGKMPKCQCAWQMLQAYETFAKGKHEFRRNPKSLIDMFVDEEQMSIGKSISVLQGLEESN